MKQLKVLFQPRPSAKTHHGGDVVVMERFVTELSKMGVTTVIDWNLDKNPADFDIVQLFNMTLPDLLKQQGEKVLAAGRPFVTLALYEDVPRFHHQSHVVAQVLIQYVANRQTRDLELPSIESLCAIPKAAPFNNNWTVQNSAAILVSGKEEERALTGIYGTGIPVRTVPFGFEVGPDQGPELFVSTYGVRDFILCVGRLESRKNQLMLLRAMEDSELPIVIVEGSITYQPDYAQAVHGFKRKGNTLIIKGLAPEMLASAYRAARVHVLPSWYELPGLVSLEAAAHGAAVVATEFSTIRDYLGSDCYYCQPWDAESIRSATLAAFYAPKNEALKTRAASFQWDKSAAALLDIYKEIVPMSTQTTHEEQHSADFQQALEAGETFAQQRDFVRAAEELERALTFGVASARLHRAIGAVMLATNQIATAKTAFGEAYAIEPHDAKTLSGLGMCEVIEKNHEAAYHYFLKSLALVPNQLVPIYQLIECSYALERYNDLEHVLRGYLQAHPNDLSMKFCLAGCLYKGRKFSEATAWVQELLRVDPNNEGALELQKRISDEQRGSLKSAIEKETQSAASPSGAIAASTAEIDLKLGRIEELKHQRSYTEAFEILSGLLGRQDMNDAQQEHASCLAVELRVIQGEFAYAKEEVAKLLIEYPASARLICTSGALMLSEGDWMGAKARFEAARIINPRADVALAGLGLIEQHQGSEEKAWECYTGALAINPENSRALLGAIELGYRLQRLDDLELIINRYVELHPADLDMIYSLAGCLYAQGKLDQAKSHIQTITLFDPNHPRAVELNQMIVAREMGM